jgi:putative heme-binding domain-containing protein
MRKRVILCVVLSFFPLGLLSQPDTMKVAPRTPEDLASGKRLFNAQCARCHGIGGTGGEGPSLARTTFRNASDDEGIFSVVRNGIQDSGMPAMWMMTDGEIWQVVGYVRSLGSTTPVKLSGDPGRGKTIFDSKGGCGACHMIDGVGGTSGPDLTGIGGRRGPEYLRKALVDPAADLPQGLLPYYTRGYAEFLPVRLVTRDGEEVSGFRVNEDTFTIQIRDQFDQFRSFKKSELKQLRKEFGTSLMPTYAGLLSSGEIEDLVAYLASLRGEP